MNQRVRRSIGQGFQLLNSGQLDQAKALSAHLMGKHADNAEALYFASAVHVADGNLPAALESIDAAVERAPGQWQPLLKRGEILRSQRRRAEARQVAAAAAELAGRDAQGLWAIGKLFSRSDDIASAIGCYERALQLQPGNPRLLAELASAQFFVGDTQSAERNIDAALKLWPDNGYMLHRRSTLRQQTADDNHVDDLQARLDRGIADAGNRAACMYALANELEDLGRDDDAFAMLEQAATLKRSLVQYDPDSELGAIDGIRQAWTAEAMARIPAGDDGEGAVFIVGMPRTGTTLVERILDRHGDATSVGELLDFSQLLAGAARQRSQQHPDEGLIEASLQIDYAALGQDYLFGLRQAALRDSPLLVDKWPANFIYCGMIHKALPRARIIHLVRDPMDACYAMFRTLFNQAYLFSFDLGELADYYIAYQRLMQHWHQVMPGSILDVHYEALVSDPEEQARRILEHCGLDWQPGVLSSSSRETPTATASAAQVRQPVHTRSIGKSRRFERGLEPLRLRLAEAGI